jgi:hypothetical protein
VYTPLTASTSGAAGAAVSAEASTVVPAGLTSSASPVPASVTSAPTWLARTLSADPLGTGRWSRHFAAAGVVSAQAGSTARCSRDA